MHRACDNLMGLWVVSELLGQCGEPNGGRMGQSCLHIVSEC